MNWRYLHRNMRWKGYDFTDSLRFPLRLKNRKGALQLICLHGICEDHRQVINGRFMQAGKLRELLTALNKYCHLLSFEAVCAGNLHPEKLNVLLTFDDGYRNVLTHALPVLEEHGAPALVFVTARTELALWPDLVDLTELLPGGTARLQRFLPASAPTKSAERKRWLCRQSPEWLLDFNRRLQDALPEKYLIENAVYHALLSDEELRLLHASPLIRLGNHSANHWSYSTLTSSEQIAETMIVEERLRSIGSTNNPFAYPFGQHTREAVQELNRLGITDQFVTDNAVLPELYRRISVHPTFSIRNQLRFIHRGRY